MWSAIAGVVVMCDAEVRHPISCGRGGGGLLIRRVRYCPPSAAYPTYATLRPINLCVM